MNIIKTVLIYRGQYEQRDEILRKVGKRRVPDRISDTRHLIKFFLYIFNGFSSKTIERHMRPLSDGFHHASILHSIKIVEGQPYIFNQSVNELKTILNNEIHN